MGELDGRYARRGIPGAAMRCAQPGVAGSNPAMDCGPGVNRRGYFCGGTGSGGTSEVGKINSFCTILHTPEIFQTT